MGRIDLDAARAARAEALADAPILVIGGKDYTLPVEVPYRFAELLARIQHANEQESAELIGDSLRILFGDAYEEVSKQMSIADIGALFDQIGKAYGTPLGPSSNSVSQLNRTSRRSKQTSKPSTASISAKRSGARRA